MNSDISTNNPFKKIPNNASTETGNSDVVGDVSKEKLFNINEEILKMDEFLKTIPRRDLEAFLNSARKTHQTHNTPETPKTRLGYLEGRNAYRLLLEIPEDVDPLPTPRQILKVVADDIGGGSLWIEEILNTRFYYAKDIVSAHSDHPIQKMMLKEGILDKGSLKRAETPNQQLRQLRRQKSIMNRILRLEKGMEELRASSIGKGEEFVGKVLTRKEKAKIMRSSGYKLKEIAEKLSVSLSTVKRMIK